MTEHAQFSKVSIVDDTSTDAAALEAVLKENFISLVIIKREVEDYDDFLESADLACKEDGALSNQRVLLIEDATIVSVLQSMPYMDAEAQSTMEAVLKTVYGKSNSLQTLAFDDVIGFSVFPTTGEVTYVISKENANFLEVTEAFAKVVESLPS